MEFSRQEYWSRLPVPSPGDLPNPGMDPGSPALQADSSLSELPGKPSDLDPSPGFVTNLSCYSDSSPLRCPAFLFRILRQSPYLVSLETSFFEEGNTVKESTFKSMGNHAFMHIFLYRNYKNSNMNVVCEISINTFSGQKSVFAPISPMYMCP